MEELNVEQRAELEKEIKECEAKILAAKINLYSVREGTGKPPIWLSWVSWGYLLSFMLASVAWGTVIFVSSTYHPLNEYALAIASGILGAATSGLISLNDRTANGWETDAGTRSPDPAEKKERFNRRLTGGFLARPFLGLVTGLLVFAGGRYGHFAYADGSHGVIFLCLIGGLFSKTLLDWLKDAFKKILAK